jgi:putative endopeptidase
MLLKKPARDRKTQIIGDFYASGMDSAAIDAKGYQPIKADLDRLNTIKIQQMFCARSIHCASMVPVALCLMNVGPDRKNVMKYIPSASQGGTTLPDRDYYLNNEPRALPSAPRIKNICKKCSLWREKILQQLQQAPKPY